MCIGGFEKDRKKHRALRRLYPVVQYGIKKYKYMDDCQAKQGI